MDELLVFDVNETLLDVRAMAPAFEARFGDASLLPTWFAQMLRNSLVATVTGRYAPFHDQGTDALVTTALRNGHEISWDDAAAIVTGMKALPPHPDVVAGLTRLHDAGTRMIALTNSAPEYLAAQMAHAGLTDVFERLLSVDAVGAFKPSPRTYGYAADEMGVELAAMRMVAAHDWDISGAMRAGMRGAFIARPGAFVGPLEERADIVVPDIGALADALL